MASPRRRLWIPVLVALGAFAAWLAIVARSGSDDAAGGAAEHERTQAEEIIPVFDADVRVGRARVDELASLLSDRGITGLVTNGGLPDNPIVAPNSPTLVAGCNVSFGGLDRDDLPERLDVAVAACGDRPLFVPTTIGLGLRIGPTRVAIDDRRLDPLFAAARRHGVPVVLEGVPAPVYFAPLEGNPLRALLEARSDLHHAREDWPDHASALAELGRRLERLPEGSTALVRIAGPTDAPHPLEAHAARVHFVTHDGLGLARRHPARTVFGSGLALHQRGWAAPDTLPDESFDAGAHLDGLLERWRGADLGADRLEAILGGTARRLLGDAASSPTP